MVFLLFFIFFITSMHKKAQKTQKLRFLEKFRRHALLPLVSLVTLVCLQSVWSLWSGQLDHSCSYSHPVSMVTIFIICTLYDFQFYLAHLWTDFQSSLSKRVTDKDFGYSNFTLHNQWWLQKHSNTKSTRESVCDIVTRRQS